jgi:hypothetical protein
MCSAAPGEPGPLYALNLFDRLDDLRPLLKLTS